jgi:hypothetical protein
MICKERWRWNDDGFVGDFRVDFSISGFFVGVYKDVDEHVR